MPGARGGVHLTRADAARRLGLDLAARIGGLMPPVAAPVFAGTTRLDGDLMMPDDGSVTLNGLTLTSQLARLSINGSYGTDGTLDVKLTSAALPNAGGRTEAGGASIGKLALDASVTGPIKAPRVHAALQAADASLPEGSLKSLDLTFDATPTAPFGDPAARLNLTADGSLVGLKLADAARNQAVGDKVTFTLRGNLDATGNGRLDALRLATRSSDIAYSGAIGPDRLDGKLRATMTELSQFSGLAGRKLAGAANLTATLSGNPRNGKLTADLDGGARGLATATPAFDRLTGGTLTLSGRIASPGSGSYTVSGLKLAGAHLAASADGTVGETASDLALKLSLPDLRRADDRLSGRATADAHLRGPLAHLGAEASIALSEARALGRPVPKLALTATVKNLPGAIAAHVTLAGTVDGKAASGTIDAARQPDRGWKVAPLAVSVGSVSLKGGVTLLGSGLATGDLALAAGNLDDISPLALTKLAGKLDGRLTLTTPNGGQNAALTLNGQRLVLAGNRIDRLTANASAADALRHPVINAAIAVDHAVVAGEAISGIKLNAAGTAAASEVTLAAKARGLDLTARGKLFPAAPIRFDLAAFDARGNGRRISLSGPASFALQDGGVAIRNLRLAVDRGTVSVNGTAGRALDLKVAVAALPLSVARIAAPQLDLAGTLDATAEIRGSAEALSGPWQVKVANFATPQSRSAGLPAINATAHGTLAGTSSSLVAALTAGKAADLKLRGTVPLSAAGPLDVATQGRIDAALANAALAAGGRRLTGTVTLDMRATGHASAPQVSGSASFANGTFTDALQGVQLKAMQARLTARGTEITIDSASATARNGGTLSASGRVKVDPAAGFPAEIKLQGHKAELVSNGLVTAVASLALDVAGPLTEKPRLTGRVDVDTVEVKIPDRLPSTLRPVDGIRHLHPTPEAKARLEARRKAARQAAARGKGKAPFDALLDIVVAAPSRIFVRGRGMDAELGGQIKVTGTLNDPAVNGAFDLRRGRMQLLSQRLDFTRGRLTFAGGLDPQLDFVAQTRTTDVTASVNISGSAAQPNITFSSQPDLPQDEILSRILFQKASGSLSAFQALQLAQSAAQLAGGGDDTFERLRKSLGVDDLDVQMGADGPTVGASRYIGNNLSIGVKTGAKPEQSGVSMRLDVTRHLKLQAEGQANGAAAAGVGAEWEW